MEVPGKVPLAGGDELRQAQEEVLRLMEESAKRKRENKMEEFFTDSGITGREHYRKHVAFFGAGRDYRERVLYGGNRSGKSVAGGYELTCHLTGLYPHWWTGRRFTRPIQALACGKEAKIVRDSIQQILVGKPGEFGTGMIPGRCLDINKCTSSRAAAGLFDGIPVKHVSGKWSMLRLRSYDQGRTAFEAVERDAIWEDEECPEDIHAENLMRTMTTNGIVYLTFTPLKGETALVRELSRRYNEGTVWSTKIWWSDAGHVTKEMIEDMRRRYSKHELRARQYGEPQLGSGAVFTEDETSYVIRPIALPPYWPRVYGLDFGWVHPTAATWGAYDRETSVLYIYDEYRRSKAEPPVHAAAVRARGAWITGISETQGSNLEDGKRIIDIYRAQGLKLKRVQKGIGSVESGIMGLQTRFSEGTIKIMDNCQMLLEEIRSFHRDDTGKIVALGDDLIASLRYMNTGLKYAKTEVEARGDVSGGNVREVSFYPSHRRVM